MKIRKEHYQHMRDAMQRVVNDNIGINTAAYAAQGRSDKRFRWDLLWAAKLSAWVCDTLYPYGVNDDHIDTALRSIVIELGVN